MDSMLHINCIICLVTLMRDIYFLRKIMNTNDNKKIGSSIGMISIVRIVIFVVKGVFSSL